MPPFETTRSNNGLSTRWILVLLLLGLATRLCWTLWLHRPSDWVDTDMEAYVDQAHAMLETPWKVDARRVFWPWGSSALIALGLLATDWLRGADPLWGVIGGLSPLAAGLLGARLGTARWMGPALGIFVLCWPPLLSQTGYFLSEPPFTLAMLLCTWLLAGAVDDGPGAKRDALLAGLAGAVAFAVRPTAALFLVLGGLVLGARSAGRAALFAAPLAAMLGFTILRFHHHTGQWGLSENGPVNLTIGRCQSSLIETFRSERERAAALLDETKDSRQSIGIPEFTDLSRRVSADSPFGLRPSLGPTLSLVGNLRDPALQAGTLQQCLDADGPVEQLRKSVVNASLLWFHNRAWPERRTRGWLSDVVDGAHSAFDVIVLPLSLVGLLGLRGWRAARVLPALQLFSIVALSAVFFGGLRHRTPFDPYAALLAMEGGRMLWGWGLVWISGFSRGLAQRHSAHRGRRD